MLFWGETGDMASLVGEGAKLCQNKGWNWRSRHCGKFRVCG